ncbi:hypothetical protein MG293_013124 [Ovis ammon polii]|uniref:Uncharacterized protein n=1 Tax=Ovis ammon polii TaxID=230172 RepID=A0AAD4Y828_OVIAM|nr:hypothetical protein MG293_013124 [Ovis ammon polii]
MASARRWQKRENLKFKVMALWGSRSMKPIGSHEMPKPTPGHEEGLAYLKGTGAIPLASEQMPLADDHLTQQTPEHQVSISGEATDCSQRQPHLEEAALGFAPQPRDPDAFGRNVDSTRQGPPGPKEWLETPASGCP